MSIVQYSTRNNIALITLNRPEKRNALSPELIQALKEAFQLAEQDPRVSIIILKANGEAFCAGADLAYLQKLQDFSYDENLQDSQNLSDLFWQIYSCKKIVIAQVQGAALAGGFGLATVCDFCFAAEQAMFGYTEVKIGFIPALVMVYLLRKVGEANARRLLLSAHFFTAAEVMEMGLVHGVFAKDQLEQDVLQFAESISRANSSQAMISTKKLITEIQSSTIREALALATKANAQARHSDDCKKGIAAFLSKKQINWSDPS